MDRGDIREAFLGAAASPDGYGSLLLLVQQRIDRGDSGETLIADLENIRPFLSDEYEDGVLDVMDRLVGWCAPDQRLYPPAP
jgi:hypothetical protein